MQRKHNKDIVPTAKMLRKNYGLTVIRIPNTEIHKNFLGVCEYIDHLVEQSLSQLR